MNWISGTSTSSSAALSGEIKLLFQKPPITSGTIQDPASRLSLRSASTGSPLGASSSLPNPTPVETPTTLPTPAESLSGQIVFIDPRLPNYKSLVAGAIAGVNVVVLDAKRDGIAQITQVLAQATQVSAIHIVSFGDEGVFTLGAAQVTSRSLDIYQNSIQKWATSFAPDADILLYGSKIGAGAGGAAFAKKLSDLAKADVAASNDRTGQGGDWVLEVNTGAIATKIAFESNVTSTYAASFDLS
ncbi:DUF4347 domain-containing protein [Phormidesmis sp. 146-35]